MRESALWNLVTHIHNRRLTFQSTITAWNLRLCNVVRSGVHRFAEGDQKESVSMLILEWDVSHTVSNVTSAILGTLHLESVI